MTSTKLTMRAIRASAYKGKATVKDGRQIWSRDVRWDGAVPGLGLRVYPSGEKAFLLSYRAQGRKRMMVLGKLGAMTLSQARDSARNALALVRDGKDPLEEKRKAVHGETLGDLIETYIEAYARPRKKTWKADQQRLARHIPAAWKSRDVRAIAQWEVAKLHQTIGEDKPYEANRLLEIIRRMYRLAPGLIAVERSLPNPVDGVEKFKERTRARWLTPEELPRLARAIDRESNVFIRAAVWLLLLTGARKSELLAAKWADVDWPRAQLRLPDTKAGQEQTVTLSAAAIAILQAIPKLDDNLYILPGMKRGRHMADINGPWDRIRKAAEVDDLRVHDLRRSLGSWLAQAGTDLNVIREALRHQDISTTLTYSRLGRDPAREAMEQHGRRVLEIAGKSRPVEVVGGGPEK